MGSFLADSASLDRAYADGRLVGFFGLATSAGCPFRGEQIDLRIAWLDGFDYGRWEAESAGRLRALTGAPEAQDESEADTAIAHLLHLSRQVRKAPLSDSLYDAAPNPADWFVSLAGLGGGRADSALGRFSKGG